MENGIPFYSCPSNVRQALLTPEEVLKITLDFYKRNYIEELFLSSGIIRSV